MDGPISRLLPLLLFSIPVACAGADARSDDTDIDDSIDTGGEVAADGTPEIIPIAALATDDPVRVGLEALGFAVDDATVAGNSIVVGGDLILYRDRLLGGQYRPVQTETTEKGYWWPGGGLVAGDRVNNIDLRYGNSSHPDRPPKIIRDAYTAAGQAYTNLGNSTVSILPSNTGPGIRLRYRTSWPPPEIPNCGSNAVACAEFPSSGNPGANIYIRSSCGGTGWGTTSAYAVALHEIGHTLGITHPNDPASTYVPGTARCVPEDATCPNNPSYPTIMQGIVSCTNPNPRALTTDDIVTVGKLYPQID